MLLSKNECIKPKNNQVFFMKTFENASNTNGQYLKSMSLYLCILNNISRKSVSYNL